MTKNHHNADASGPTGTKAKSGAITMQQINADRLTQVSKTVPNLNF